MSTTSEAPVTPFTVHQHDDFEPQHGLPERLPASERLLWQGSPEASMVWRRIFHGTTFSFYFAVLLAWQVAGLLADGAATAEALRIAARVAPLYAIALGLLAIAAWLTARTTVYTLTERRVVMRIGIVLTVSYNLPLRCIDAAHLRPLARGVGDIALELKPATRIAFLHLWPHTRPWYVKRTQPMLRCLAGAAGVAEQLVAAWAQVNGRALPSGAPADMRAKVPTAGSVAEPARAAAAMV